MTTELFSDLLVIDCASFIAGPAAATIMSDFGARVIKIEPPGVGDSYRRLILGRGGGVIDYFWTLDSRNKESLAIDLKAPAGRAVLEKLLAKADVFITNFPFPVREKLKLRAEDLLPLNKRLIYASMSPYGETGAERDRTAFDTTAYWARSGLMEMVRATGDTERALSVPGMGDHPTAVSMYAAITTALYRRAMTGEGGEVRTSLLANGIWSNSCQVQAALCDIDLIPRGARGTRSAMTETYETLDGRTILMSVANPAREWPAFATAMGHPEWLADPRFSTPLERMANAPILVGLLQDIFRQHDFDHWRDVLSPTGVNFGIIGNPLDHTWDPQVEAAGIVREFEDGDGLRTVDSPFHVVGEDKKVPRMAPAIGQHTRSILEEVGCSEAEIAELMSAAAE